MQATWNGTVIAASDDIVTVEGNAYFPAEALVEGCFQPSSPPATAAIAVGKGRPITTTWLSMGR